MGRFSPTVLPVANTGLADALGAFTQTYMQASNRKQEREAQDRQFDAEMLRSGYEPDELAQALGGSAPPSGVLDRVRARLTGRTDPSQISNAVTNAAPGVLGANDVNEQIAAALSSDTGLVESRPTSGGNYATNEKPIQQQGTPPVRRVNIGGRSYRQTDEARSAAEEKRRAAALAERLGQAQIGNYESEADLRRYQIEHPKPVAPVPGSQEWLNMKVAEAKIGNEYGYHAPPTQFSFGTTLDANGQPVVLRQNTKTGEVTPTDAVKPQGSGGGRGSATIQKAVAENKTNMSVIDDALNELNAHPDAVGGKRSMADFPLVGGFGDAANQRFDPAGVAARASLSNVASLVIKDRSGSAVSVSESARLRPFIPSVGDTPEAIRVKLRKLKAAIQTETDLLERGSGASSHAAPDHSAAAGATSHVPSYEEWLASKTK